MWTLEEAAVEGLMEALLMLAGIVAGAGEEEPLLALRLGAIGIELGYEGVMQRTRMRMMWPRAWLPMCELQCRCC